MNRVLNVALVWIPALGLVAIDWANPTGFTRFAAAFAVALIRGQ